MVSSFFSSIGISLGTSVFVFTVAVMYFLKNKNNKTRVSNKAFVFLIGITMWLGLTELLVTLSLSRTTEPTFINNFACRQLTFGMYLWNLAFLAYVYILVKRTTDENFKLKTSSWIILFSAAIFSLVVIFLLPVEYTLGANNGPFVIIGPLLYFTVLSNVVTNAATYVNMSPYFFEKDVEIVLKSEQLQPIDNRVSVHLDTK